MAVGRRGRQGIHTDFETGFICKETIANDYELGEQARKDAGKCDRKADYLVDGDVILPF